MTEQQQYENRRREVTSARVAKCPTTYELLKLKAEREHLAELYTDDGAFDIAQCIREIDIPVIEKAIATTGVK